MIRDWCCQTPISGPHLAGCPFSPDGPLDYDGPAVLTSEGPVYDATAALAAQVGPDAAIEAVAQCIDELVPGVGVGDVLRDAWQNLVRELLLAGPRTAASSGAAHELAYYGDRR